MVDDSKALVLFAYDGSDFAKAGVRVAGEQLGGGRRALVLTAFEPFTSIPFFGAGGVPIESETTQQLLSAAQEAAEKTAEEGCALAREAGFEAEPIVADGDPIWNQIVEVAEEHDVDLIVIGSRGLSGLKHVALGSVAAAVAQHSKRSVLVVHDR